MRKICFFCLSALLGSVASCDSVRFTPVAAPSLLGFQASPPSVPEAQPVVEPDTPLTWEVLDRTAKAPFRRKLVGVQAAMRTDDAKSERRRGALTSMLLARLMDDGFQSVMDLAAASEIDAEVSRSQGGASVKLSGKLDQVLTVASPLRADYVLTLTFAALPAAMSRKTVRYEVPEEQLAEYRAAHERYEKFVRDYLTQLDASFADYTQAFEDAKAEYERNKGRYAEFPKKTSGQHALERYEEDRARYQHLRGQAEAALTGVPSPQQFAQDVARKTSTERSTRARLAGWASLQETGSNRVVWLAWCQGEVDNADAALDTLTQSLVQSLPTEQRGSR
ncbi:MAG TPA: hypothetical protein PL046_25800 [Polyangiaceae bacterium]|jgi:hypothetical protein|nr:hypothetical protein [Sedimentisphaerales bacterium]HOH03789.1 hypothetical protein [Polyangiaceae bacterium]